MADTSGHRARRARGTRRGCRDARRRVARRAAHRAEHRPARRRRVRVRRRDARVAQGLRRLDVRHRGQGRPRDRRGGGRARARRAGRCARGAGAGRWGATLVVRARRRRPALAAMGAPGRRGTARRGRRAVVGAIRVPAARPCGAAGPVACPERPRREPRPRGRRSAATFLQATAAAASPGRGRRGDRPGRRRRCPRARRRRGQPSGSRRRGTTAAPVPAGVDVGVDGVGPLADAGRTSFYRMDTALVVPQVARGLGACRHRDGRRAVRADLRRAARSRPDRGRHHDDLHLQPGRRRPRRPRPVARRPHREPARPGPAEAGADRSSGGRSTATRVAFRWRR